MKRKLSILTFTLLGVATNITAQIDSVGLGRRLFSHSLPSANYSAIGTAAIWSLDLHSTSLTQAGAAFHLSNGQDIPLDLFGQKEHYASFYASTYQAKDKDTRIWGNASYTQGLRHDVIGNETSDAMLLYPYLTADTVGGNLHGKQYLFGGGYAQERHATIFAISMKYRALQEYRSVDPRPQNTVADLSMDASIGRRLSNRYKISLSAGFRRYKQTNSISNYSEIGVAKTYHLTGLGTHYYRFAGTNNLSNYKGRGGFAAINLQKKQGKGISAVAEYQLFIFDKILSSLNNLCLSSLRSQHIRTAAVWQISEQTSIKADVNYRQKTGTENLFGDASGNTYPQIASVKMFEMQRLDGQIHASYSISMANATLSIMPMASANDIQISYANPQRKISSTNLTGQLHLRGDVRLKQDVAFLEVAFRKIHNIHMDKQLDSSKDVINNAAVDLSQLLASDCLGVRAAIGYAIPLKNTMLQTNITWKHNHWSGGLPNMHQMEASIKILL